MSRCGECWHFREAHTGGIGACNHILTLNAEERCPCRKYVEE